VKKEVIIIVLLFFSLVLSGSIKNELRNPVDMKYYPQREFKVIEYLKQYFVNENWEDSLRYYYSYEDTLIQITYQKISDETFENYGKLCYLYNDENILTDAVYYNWENEDWINSYKYSYYYDNNDNIVTNVYSEWIEENWLAIYLGTYSYENDNLIQEFWQYWEDEETLVNSHLYSYSYDQNENLIEIHYQVYENGIELTDIYKFVYSYDDQLHNTELLYQVWENDDWQNSYQYIYYYDEDGNLIYADYQTWQRGWLDDSYATYSYDENGNLSELLWQYWYDDELYNYSKEYYTYEDFLSVDEFDIPKFQVWNFPNPFCSETTISFNVTQTSPFITLEIYNIKGQIVKKFSIGDSRFSVVWNGKDEKGNQVSPGIYLLKIKTENYQITKKMLRSR